jgi:hypothetical protein
MAAQVETEASADEETMEEEPVGELQPEHEVEQVATEPATEPAAVKPPPLGPPPLGPPKTGAGPPPLGIFSPPYTASGSAHCVIVLAHLISMLPQAMRRSEGLQHCRGARRCAHHCPVVLKRVSQRSPVAIPDHLARHSNDPLGVAVG